jgi:hypothetical protein
VLSVLVVCMYALQVFVRAYYNIWLVANWKAKLSMQYDYRSYEGRANSAIQSCHGWTVDMLLALATTATEFSKSTKKSWCCHGRAVREIGTLEGEQMLVGSVCVDAC